MNDFNKTEEWFFQSDYDLETAEAMYITHRYIYCIFMCHLSIEKALKAIFVKQTSALFPAKIHNLLYFVDKINIELNDIDFEFVTTLDKISVPTRYPESLRKMIAIYNQKDTLEILEKTKNLQSWLKQQ